MIPLPRMGSNSAGALPSSAINSRNEGAVFQTV
jgi:hypothetical protein